MNSDEPKKRAHRASRAGRGATKKKEAKSKLLPGDEKSEPKLDMSKEAAKKRNAKAFGVNSAVAMRRKFNHSQDTKNNREFIPVVKNQSDEPPPLIVALVGPPKVGKSTLIKSLIKHYTRQKLSCVDGPITVVSGKHRRLTLLECPVDLNSMIDIAKVADLVLLMVDASYGFEMEIFEFLHIAQVHGLPRIMGVATHLDCLPPGDKTNRVKKKLKHRFWTELYDGATLFCLSRLAKEGVDEYMSQEISNLARFISVIKTRPIMWRESHPYLLADRLEDMTAPEKVDAEPKCDRDVALYGFVRGANLNPSNEVHLPGVGDFQPSEISLLPDPCPLPKTIKKRSLNQKERVLYAPLTGYGGLLYDKDAIYIDLESGKQDEQREGDDLLDSLKGVTQAKNEDKGIKLIQGGTEVTSEPEDEEEVDEGEDEAMEESGSEEDEEEAEGLGEAASDSDNADSDVEMETDEEDEEEIRKMEQQLEGDAHQEAAEKYRKRASGRVNLKQLVYGSAREALSVENEQVAGGLFVRVMDRLADRNNRDETIPTVAKFERLSGDELREQIEAAQASIQDCFVTGDWGDEDATRLLKEDDDFDEELFGDFEDLEKDDQDEGFDDEDGEEEEMEEETEKTEDGEEKTAKQKAYEKKMKLKAAFDREYDDKGNPMESYFEQWKKETEEQSARNKEVFADLPDEIRVGYEGYRAGMYVRVMIKESF